MCGRYALFSSAEEIEEYYDVEIPSDYEARYNIAPTQKGLVIADSGAQMMKWGLVPGWADEKLGAKMINARAETVAEKPAFRGAFMKKRCVVVTNGFYEWKKVGKSKKPYFITGGLMSFAGLWEQKDDLLTFTIITVKPNEIMKPIHNRMPAVLGKDAWRQWLKKPSHSVLQPAPVDMLSVVEVSTEVNNAHNQGSQLLNPVKRATLADFS